MVSRLGDSVSAVTLDVVHARLERMVADLDESKLRTKLDWQYRQALIDAERAAWHAWAACMLRDEGALP